MKPSHLNFAVTLPFLFLLKGAVQVAFAVARPDEDNPFLDTSRTSLKGVVEEDYEAVVVKCSGAYSLDKTGPIQITAGTEPSCNFTILGSSKCQPILTCSTLKLKGSAACDKTYLQVSDGWGSARRFCGSKRYPPNGLIASKGARDLFLNLKGHSGGVIECEGSCSKSGKNSAGPEALPPPPPNRKRKTENCICGIQNVDDRIVGGEDAARFEFPWQAAIVPVGSREPFCAGSLINNKWILSAAHCFGKRTKPNSLQVLLHAYLLNGGIVLGSSEMEAYGGSGWNESETTDEDERTIRLDVVEIINHPLFTQTYDFDVSLLRLKEPLQLTQIEASPICLPRKGEKSGYTGKTPVVIGWGTGHVDRPMVTRRLQKLRVPTIPHDKCQEMMNSETEKGVHGDVVGLEITERMFCAGYQKGKKDACTGDSGGPLVLADEKKQHTLVGIVSWGVGCAHKNRPGIYSKVTDLIDWVMHHVGKSDPKWCRVSPSEDVEE